MPRRDQGNAKANPPAGEAMDQTSPAKVDKVALAKKHPGVFAVTSELEEETGEKLPVGIELQEVTSPPRERRNGRNERKISEDGRGGKETQVEKSDKDGNEAIKMEIEGQKEEAEKAEAPEPAVKTKEGAVVKEEDEEKEEGLSGEIEVSAEGEGDKATDVRSTRATRRSARKMVKDEEEKRKKEEPPPDPRLAASEPMEVAAVAACPPGDADLSEAESEASLKDNESVDSGSTLATRSSDRTRSKDGGGGGAAATRSTEGSKKSRAKAKSKSQLLTAKGKSRRHIFKKSTTKAPAAVARTVTSDRVFYNGQFYTRGDIVSVTDVDGGVYYAQLRGFMTDQYCEKSGVITWLLPTEGAPPPEEGFDASCYIVGPEEELPRRLGFFTFVMHAPDDYYHHRNAPYPVRSHSSDQEYVLTRAGPKIRLIKQGKAVYQDRAY